MKHIFLVNPGAGNGKKSVDFVPEILQVVKEKNLDYKIHRTISEQELITYVEREGKEEKEEMRFYAVGGDGTINLVLNAMKERFADCSLAVIPAGTGNDLVRNFGGKAAFCDLRKLVSAKEKLIDIMEYKIPEAISLANIKTKETEIRNGFAINMINIGFDADVVRRTITYKKNPLFAGPSAYATALAGALIKRQTYKIEIRIDDGEVLSKEVFFSAIAGGKFSGGGFKGMPWADLTDGFLDVLRIKPVTRRFFISLVGKYKDGTYHDDPKGKGIYEHERAKKVKISSADFLPLSIDGETVLAKEIEIEIAPKAVKFISVFE